MTWSAAQQIAGDVPDEQTPALQEHRNRCGAPTALTELSRPASCPITSIHLLWTPVPSKPRHPRPPTGKRWSPWNAYSTNSKPDGSPKMVTLKHIVIGLVSRILAHPESMMTEFFLEKMRRYDRTLASHGIDVCVLALIVGVDTDVMKPIEQPSVSGHCSMTSAMCASRVMSIGNQAR